MTRIAVLALIIMYGAVSVSGQVPVATSTSAPGNTPPSPDLSKKGIPTVGFCDLVIILRSMTAR
jgi:hypothetical protein